MPDAEKKTCTRCGETKPVSDYHPRPSAPGKYVSKCRPCHAAYQNERYHTTKTLIRIPRDLTLGEKPCTACGVVKKFDDFHIDRAQRDGRTTRCKPCYANAQAKTRSQPGRKEQMADYQREHREATVVRAQRWRDANPEDSKQASRDYRASHLEQERARLWLFAQTPECKAYRAAWAKSHPEQVAASKKKWRLANLEERRAKEAAYLKAHPEVARKKMHKRRAKIYGVGWEDFYDFEIFERDGWVCQICMVPVERPWPNREVMPSLDHKIPLALDGPHSRANCRLAHLKCNQDEWWILLREQKEIAARPIQ